MLSLVSSGRKPETVDPGNETALVARLPGIDRERLRSYRDLLDFYNGRQWPDGLARRGERRLTLNYARVLVEKVTSYLMADRTFAVDPEDESAEERDRARRAEAALARVAEENGLEALDFETEIDAAILGDGCYKVTWDSDERRVRITAPDVQGIYAWSRPDDASRLWRVASRYLLPAEAAGDWLATGPGESAKGLSAGKAATVVEVWTDRTFGLYVDGKPVRSGPNPYGVIPFVIFPNLRQPKQIWGMSDLPAIVEPARELNRAFSQVSRILEISGNPIAVLENVDQANDIAVGPGAVWEIPEQARAYLLDLLSGGGVGLHMEYITALYRALHDLAEAPRTAFGDNSRSLAGVALEIELQPLLQKIARKRLIRTPAYRQRNALILKLIEQFTGERFAPYRSRVVWGAVTPRDASRQLSDERGAVASGLRSRRTAMGRLGVADPETELERWLEEQRVISEIAVTQAKQG